MESAIFAATFCILMLFVSRSHVNGNGLLFPFGAAEGDSFLSQSDDASSGAIPITIPFPFFDHSHDALFVNTNGVVSFLIPVSQYTLTPFPLDGDRRLVAVFWADVDISHGGSVSYRKLHRTPSNEELFGQADGIIRQAFIDQSKFSSSWMFIATWDEVPFFGASGEALQITNTFQALLVTNGRHSFAIYNYEDIRWTTGTASGGDSSNGLGGTPAQVGFNAGDGFTFFGVPESRTDAIVDIDQDSNIGTRGRFLFRIDSSEIVDSGCNSEGSLAVFPISGSMLGGDIVLISGPCLDESSTIVCRFADVEVPGQVVSNTTARCVSPLVFEVGRLPLRMSTNGGNSFNFTGIFTYLSPEDITPSVKRLEATDWMNEKELTITWDTELLRDYVTNVSISVYGYEEDLATGEAKLPFVYSLYGINEEQTVPYSAGRFSFIRPRAPSGAQYTVGAIRVSQYVQGQDEAEQTLPGMWSDIHNLHWLYPVPDPSAWCDGWAEEARSDLDFLEVTEPCPCTLTQALVDVGRFSEHPLCYSPESCEMSKPGAVYCVRADTVSEFGGGQECCYGSDDNILDVARSAGSGFAQRRHHGGVAPYKVAGRVPYLSHWFWDILPMEHCCIYSQLFCQVYKRVRPSQTCEDYQPPQPAIGTGDTHLFTLDGTEYAFNGVGVYTLLETCGGLLELQARMAVLQQGDRATKITALAGLHRDKSDQIHVEVSERRGIDVWFRQGNDSEWTMIEFEGTQIRRVELEGVAVFYRDVNNSGVMTKNIHVNFKCGVSLVVSTTSGLLNVFTSLQKELKGRTRGLYGNWNGEKNDDFERPDGTILPANATMQDVHQEFGPKWQIKPEDSLFRYPRGKGPSDYTDVTFVPLFWSPSDVIIDESALRICGNDTVCAFNFVVTGNEDIARATKEAVDSYKTAVKSAALVICGALRVPTNGQKEVSRGSVGGVASFTCDDGYILQRESELVCQENGTWSGEVPICAPVTCDGLMEPANGQVEVSSNNVGGVARFTCDDGYTLRGNSELVCQENGTWSWEVPTCVPVTCDALMEPANGQKRVSSNNVGGVARFTCDDGYTLRGNSELVCQENGTWSWEVPTCVPVTCDALMEPANGHMEASSNSVGGVASFTCDDGYTLHNSQGLQGDSEIVCQDNGTWSREVPSCLPRSNGGLTGLESWKLGLIIGGSCLLLLIVVVAGISYTMYRKSRKYAFTLPRPSEHFAESTL
ncbi:sushi domain-containing protein 2-like [Patiria miniata]|uniref:Sushi domain-containing protein 2-like n=1 Tax=Patiria miniata TaxID=46514 RepID=A0A914BC47_PATMI|nr:sushi domain-containing protein 2-like [Patiria miniata]